MTVGMLKVILGLDSKGFETGINTITGKTTLLQKFTDKTFKAIGTGIKIGMAAAGAAMIKAVIDFGKFETQLANVSTMLSKETMPMMAEFKNGLLSMSEDFGESTATLSKGLYDILSASIPASEAMDVLEVSTKAAKAGLSDTGTAADAITTLINSFGDSTKDATYYSDILFSTVLYGKTTFNEMAGTVGNVATLFATAGGSAEELAGMVSILTRNGIDTATAMTNVKGVVTALLKPTGELTAALEGTTVQGDGFTAVMEKIANFPPADLAKMFPNVRALTGVVIAAKGLGEEVEKINGVMATGTVTQDAYEKNTDTLAFKFAQLKETFKTVSVLVGEQLAPQLKEMFQNMIDWVKSNKDNIINFFTGLATAIENTAKFVYSLKDVITGLFIAIAGFAILHKVEQAFKNFGVAISLSTGPIGAVVIGIGLLVAGIIKLQQLTNQYKDDTERLNAALNGTAKTADDYNDALVTQRERINDLIKSQTRQATVGRGMSAESLKIQEEQHKKQLEIESEKLNLIIDNKTAFLKAEEEKKKAAEEASKAELERQFAEQKAIIEKEMLEQQTASERRARADQIAAIDAQLADLRMTDIERIEARKKALQDMGYAEEDILLLLKNEYKDYYKELEKEGEESTEERKKQGVLLTQADLKEAFKRGLNAKQEYEEKERLAKQWLPYENKLVKDAADQQTKDRAMSYVEDWQNNTKHVDKLKYTWLDFTNDMKENWVKLTDIMADTFNSTMESIMTLMGYAAEEQIRSIEEQYGAMTEAEKEYQAFLDGEEAKDKQDKKDRLAQLKKDLATETDAVKRAELEKQIAELETKIKREALADAAAQSRIDAEEEAAAEILKIKKDLWKKEKKMRTAMAVIDTAGAVIKALVNPGGWAGVALAVAAGITGALQIAMINSEPEPFIKGGMVGGGVFKGDPGIDTNDVSLTSGEYVMPPQQTSDNINELEEMRLGGGGTRGINISATPVNLYLDSEKIGEGVIDWITDQSDKGTFRINPKVIGVA